MFDKEIVKVLLRFLNEESRVGGLEKFDLIEKKRDFKVCCRRFFK